MANSISIKSTANSERITISDEHPKQNNITDIALETISDQVVGGPCMLKWDAFLADLEADKWKVNLIDNSILGPNGEYFDLQDMREIVFQPRKEQAIKRLLSQCCHYNESEGVIYRRPEDKIKLQVKQIFNFESHLEGLEFKGRKIDSSDMQNLNKKFEENKQIFLQFLNEKKLSYDLATGVLSNELGILTQEAYLDQLEGFNEWWKAILDVRKKYHLSEECISELEEEGWKINYEGEYAINPATDGFATLEGLKARFDVEDHLPDFEEVKKVFAIMVDYNEFVEALEELGWIFNWDDRLLQAPHGMSYGLDVVAIRWKFANVEWLLPVDNAISRLDQYYESEKDQILKGLIKNANERFGMRYDKAENCFTDGKDALSVRKMVIHLIIMQLELI